MNLSARAENAVLHKQPLLKPGPRLSFQEGCAADKVAKEADGRDHNTLLWPFQFLFYSCNLLILQKNLL